MRGAAHEDEQQRTVRAALEKVFGVAPLVNGKHDKYRLPAIGKLRNTEQSLKGGPVNVLFLILVGCSARQLGNAT